MAPSIIKEAKKVTLVQRSPAWILNIDSKEKSSRTFKTFQVLWDYFSSRIFKKASKTKNDIWKILITMRLLLPLMIIGIKDLQAV